MKKFYRRIPGMEDKYLVNSIGDVYDLRLKRELSERITKNGSSYYILKYNGQTYKYARTTLRHMAYGCGKYKGQEKGEIVYIEEGKVC